VVRSVLMFEQQCDVGTEQVVIARAFGGRDISALCPARSMGTLASHRRAVVNAEFVGPQNVPAGRMGTSPPVGFFAIDEELLVEAADDVPGRPG
jgi:hypothetical protein